MVFDFMLLLAGDMVLFEFMLEGEDIGVAVLTGTTTALLLLTA